MMKNDSKNMIMKWREMEPTIWPKTENNVKLSYIDRQILKEFNLPVIDGVKIPCSMFIIHCCIGTSFHFRASSVPFQLIYFFENLL